MISKRASVKAIAYAEKTFGAHLAKNANWEAVFDTVMEGYEYSVQSQCERTGGNTIIKLHKGDDLVETFTVPNSEVFDEDYHEWDWSYIYKTIVEWMMSRKRKVKKTKMSQKQILERIDILKDIIKAAKGSDKRKAIKEYNDLSKQVIQVARDPEPKKVNTISINELRDQRDSLYPKISYAKKKGRDTTELENKLKELQEQIKNYK